MDIQKKTIFIASDHGGYHLKCELLKEISLLKNFPQFKIELNDLGCDSSDSVDYPDYANKVCHQLNPNLFPDANKRIGILICGSGQGMAMRANRYPWVRAALIWNEQVAQLSREHNNANVLCLPGRFMEKDLALRIFQTFLNTPFAEGRHTNRVAKLGSAL